jgi:hypothetical protein
MRDYPPAHVIHEAGCADAPAGLFTFRASALIAYPTSRPHACFNRATIVENRQVVAEPGDDQAHAYMPSSLHPADAVKRLCRVCRGTHPEKPVDLAEWLGVAS